MHGLYIANNFSMLYIYHVFNAVVMQIRGMFECFFSATSTLLYIYIYIAGPFVSIGYFN